MLLIHKKCTDVCCDVDEPLKMCWTEAAAHRRWSYSTIAFIEIFRTAKPTETTSGWVFARVCEEPGEPALSRQRVSAWGTGPGTGSGDGDTMLTHALRLVKRQSWWSMRYQDTGVTHKIKLNLRRCPYRRREIDVKCPLLFWNKIRELFSQNDKGSYFLIKVNTCISILDTSE